MIDYSCVRVPEWDGEYPGQDDSDTPFMFEDDTPEVCTLEDIPF